jgi:hypothetical protein
VGRRGLRQGQGGGQARPALRRLLRLPLVPRDGPRVVRGPRHRRGDEPPVRQHQGGSGGTPRRRRRLHVGRAVDDGTGWLAHDRVPHPRRAALLRRHVLPQGRSPRPARLHPHPGGGRRRLAQPARGAGGPGGQAHRRPGPGQRPGGGGRRRGAGREDPGAGRLQPGGPIRRPPRRVRRRPQVPPGHDARLPVALPRPYRPRPSSGHGRRHSRRHGRRRHVRPGGRRVPPLLGGRLLARAPLREDALRPGQSAAGLPPRPSRHR